MDRALSCSVIVLSGASQVVLVVKNPPASAGDVRDAGFIPGWEDHWRRAWKLTPIFLPEEPHGQKKKKEPHGQRNLVGFVHWVTKSWT